MLDPELSLGHANFIAFDTETTGLYPVAGRLVEIGAVRFGLDGEDVAVFEQLIDPEMTIPPDAQAVNQISDEMVYGMPTVDKVLPAFMDFLGSADSILLAHNAPFDLDFIGVDMLRLGLDLPRHMVVDTCALAQSVMPGLVTYRLASLSVMLGVADQQMHRALGDARLAKGVFLALLGRVPQVSTVGDLAELVPPLSFERVRAYLAKPPEGLGVIEDAIRSHGVIAIVYDGGTKGLEPREVTPRAILRSAGYTYLAAYCHSDEKEKMFRLDRIRSLE
jgi:DNA polymerase-3 subunit epsilon